MSSSPLYNNDWLEFTVPANSIATSNGEKYRWELSLRTTDDFVSVTRGVGKRPTSWDGNRFKTDIDKNGVIKSGMIIYTWEDTWGSGAWAKRAVVTSTSVTEGYLIVVATLLITPNGAFQGTFNYRVTSDTMVLNLGFNTASSPSLTIANTTIYSYAKTINATYSHPQNIRLLRYRWELYLGATKIHETDYLSDNNISYSYSGFISANQYTLRLILENQIDQVVTAERSFTPLYSDTLLTERLQLVSRGNHIELNLSQYGLSPAYNKVIIFKSINDAPYKYYTLTSTTDNLNDYNVSPGSSYKYQVLFVNGSEILKAKSDVAIVKRNSWWVSELESSFNEGEYIVGNTWKFSIGIEPAVQTQNLDYTDYKTLGRYFRRSYGDSNYITSGLTCYLGDVSCESGDYVDDINMLEQWRNFVASPSLKLVQDSKGQNLICVINDNSNQPILAMSNPDTITFSFSEFMNSKDVPIIRQ